MEYLGYWRNSKWNFQEKIKNNVEYLELIKIKNRMDIPGVLVLGPKISKEYDKILRSF